MCTLHSCRQGKAQQPLTALFINSIQDRRTRSNQWHATHIHVSARSYQHISLLCAPEMRRFSFVFGRSTTVVATRTTADRHTHTHMHTMYGRPIVILLKQWRCALANGKVRRNNSWADLVRRDPRHLARIDLLRVRRTDWSQFFGLIFSGNYIQVWKQWLPNGLCSPTQFKDSVAAAHQGWTFSCALCMFKKK